MMFKTYTLTEAASYSIEIALPCLLIAIAAYIRVNRYCRQNKNVSVTIKRKVGAAKITVLLLFSIAGWFVGNLISIVVTFNVAISHGMTPNDETHSYELTYGEILSLNRQSIKETNIDLNNLKGKAVIYVRYDCPDCVRLHDQLAAVTDIMFLSSRSERGQAARKMYNISLTDVPQGVYIDPDGNAMIINIVSDDKLMLDLNQLSILREMEARHVLLTDISNTSS